MSKKSANVNVNAIQRPVRAKGVNAVEQLLLQLVHDGKSKQCSIRVWRV